MVPGLTLRTVLETTPNLTLDRLTQFLEAHYEQKNAHDLCNTMTNMLQFPEESVYAFVMRCLEVRQKVLLVSKKSCDLSYSSGFINKLFLRTIERGVSNPFVVQEIKPLLRSENVCDEALLAAIIKASASEKETYSTTLTVNENRAVASLVGERCFLNCYLNDHPSILLLDSGAQVSIINIEEFAKNFPNVKTSISVQFLMIVTPSEFRGVTTRASLLRDG